MWRVHSAGVAKWDRLRLARLRRASAYQAVRPDCGRHDVPRRLAR